MKQFDTFFLIKLRSKAARRASVYLTVFSLFTFYVVYQAYARSGGITGRTQKGATPGCTCHNASANTNTTVTVSTTATTIETGKAYTFTVKVTNTGELKAGIDVAVSRGALSVSTGSGLKLQSEEVTHTSPATLPASWDFTYTAPSSAGTDTIFATGNAVDGDGKEYTGGDQWNHAAKFVITVVAPATKAIAISRTTINMGNVRVGTSSADSFQIKNTDAGVLTVSSGPLASPRFTTKPSTSNRTIAAGVTEIDSIIFSPTARGVISDTIVITSDATVTADQRKTIYVTGKGIQAVFNAPTTLAFGNVRTATSRTRYVIFENTGDDTLFLSNPSIVGSGLSISSAPQKLVLLPNVKDSVGVMFSPVSRSTYAGTLSFSAANGVTTNNVSITGKGVAPSITMNALTNLGSIRVGRTITSAFVVRNTGDDTLHVTNIQITGGDPQKFNLSGTTNFALPPNESHTSTVMYTPKSPSFDTLTLTVSSDDPLGTSAAAKLYGSGTLPNFALPQNGDTVNFGGVRVNSTSTFDIKVTNSGNDAVLITNTALSNTDFTIVTAPAFIEAGREDFITVKFAPKGAGLANSSLIVTSDDPSNAADTVYLSGFGTNSKLNIPTELDFGSIPVGTNATASLTITNEGTAPVMIKSYRLSATSVFILTDTSAHTIAAGASVTLSGKFQPAASGTQSATLTILTDDPEAPTRTVTLRGVGTSADVVISPQDVDFGKHLLGTDSTVRITIANKGAASIAIIDASTDCSADFTLTEIPQTPIIAAGDSTHVSIRFAPTIKGVQTCSLTVKSADNKLFIVTLQGEGNEPPSAVEIFRRSTFSIFPNPSNTMLNIKGVVENGSEFMATIFDAAGRMVNRFTLPSGDLISTVDVSNLSNGMYTLRIAKIDGETFERKIVIAH